MTSSIRRMEHSAEWGRIIETEPDPLVAWGLYRRAHRRPEVPA